MVQIRHCLTNGALALHHKWVYLLKILIFYSGGDEEEQSGFAKAVSKVTVKALQEVLLVSDIFKLGY